MRNPDWVRDEIILAMDLNVSPGRKQLPPGHNEVVRLSEVMNLLHHRRQRNQADVAAKLNDAWRMEGRIACEACGFDFLVFCGELASGFAERHHPFPLSDSPFERKTRISDPAIVCANWHRMLHRGRPLPTIDAVRIIIAQAKQLQPGGLA